MNSAVLNVYYPWLATRKNGPTSTVGVMLMDDKVAPANGLNFQSVGVSLSYAFSLNKYQRLSFGLMPEFGFHSLGSEGFRTISQYSVERGYSPSLPLNEPLLGARASYLSWNTGLSWLKKDKRGNSLSSAGFAINNINKPTEVFESFENSIPLALQGYFFTTAYENQFYSILPEAFFSSYGNNYQLQLGGKLKYNLRYSSFKEGNINFTGRYNLFKSVIVGAELEQPFYSVGLSTDLYIHSNSPFTQAFEVSFALKNGVEGRNFNFKRNKKNRNKKEKSIQRKNKHPNKRKDQKNRKSRESSSKKRSSVKDPLKEQIKGENLGSEVINIPEIKRKELDPLFAPIDSVKVEEFILKQVELYKGKVLLGSAAKNINFQLGSTALTSSSEKVLAEVAVYLLAHPNYKIIVTGHTDNVGSVEFNQELSIKRAAAVKDFLIGQGVAKSQITIEGVGMSKPLVPNTSENNRRLNRRVEFLLYQD